MTTLKANKRQVCSQCGYPQSTCLCAWVNPITAPLNIIILQHPKEVKHAKNTVKLLTLGLEKITVLQGEKPNDWEKLAQKLAKQPQNYSLFYPHEQSISVESISSPESKESVFPVDHNVIFIDASWRKALKIWHLNPWLQQCNSWHFTNPPDNQYHIRQTTQQDSLSTLESVVYVLEYTHNINCKPLHTLLSKMQQKCFLEHISK
ncbi:MAG: DTW domain-containing protein YfiP [Paraglaciecola sp.]|jgi:DTW domain-containing protein YfiP